MGVDIMIGLINFLTDYFLLFSYLLANFFLMEPTYSEEPFLILLFPFFHLFHFNRLYWAYFCQEQVFFFWILQTLIFKNDCIHQIIHLKAGKMSWNLFMKTLRYYPNFNNKNDPFCYKPWDPKIQRNFFHVLTMILVFIIVFVCQE